MKTVIPHFYLCFSTRQGYTKNIYQQEKNLDSRICNFCIELCETLQKYVIKLKQTISLHFLKIG